MGFTTLKSYGSQFSITNKITPVVKTIAATPAPTTQTAYQKLLVDKKPWGRYGAESWDQNTNKLPDLGGNSARDATTAGVTTCMTTGNGATGNISCIGGSTTSTINFTPGSIPPTFTLCSITRYSGTSGARILASTSGYNFLHGHWGVKRGVCYYNSWLTQKNSSVGIFSSWLNCCGTNSTSTSMPNNILIDGVPSGISTGGAITPANTSLGINLFGNEQTNFEFSQLLIFDQALTAAEMVTVSDAFRNYLDTGVLDSPTYLSPYQRVIKTKKPWGRYGAESWDQNTNKLPDLGGNSARDATTAGVMTCMTTGNGSTANIACIGGTTTSNISFPAGSLPTIYAIFSITRYNTGTHGRILTNYQGNSDWLHGHFNNMRGVAYHGASVGWITPEVNVGNNQDWLSMGATNSGIAIPNNVYVDYKPVGVRTDTIVNQGRLSINLRESPSDFEFSQLIIFDTALTVAEMVTVSDAFKNYLSTGVLDSP